MELIEAGQKPEFQASSAGINKDSAARSHNGTSWSPEERAASEIKGFATHVQSIYEELKAHTHSDTQREYLNTQMVIFQGNYAAKYNDYLSAKGRCISSFIAGGSNFPVRRAEKANNAEQRRYEDMTEWIGRAKATILREIKKMGVEEAGGELAVLQKKIERLEKAHAAMVASNKIIKKKNATQEEKVQAIIKETGLSEKTAREMFVPDFAGNIGFPGWSLQNSNANIHRMKARLQELQTKETTPTSDIRFTGGVIQDSQEHDRVRIFFDEKPDQDIINKLKSEGWRWSPAMHAWQRKRTPQAMSSAKRIIGVV